MEITNADQNKYVVSIFDTDYEPAQGIVRDITSSVVNRFQFVFLREDSQEGVNLKRLIPRCELISICIFR